MSGLKGYSTTAASNTAALTGVNFDENQLPSTVNDSARQLMADIRTDYENREWRDWGHTVTRTGATTFTIATDVTSIYVANRPIKCTDSTTLYGYIASSSYGAPNTTVTVTLDSGSLSASLTAVALGFEPTKKSTHVTSVRNAVSSADPNTFTAAQTFTNTVSVTTTGTTGPVTITSTDAGASVGPNLILDRNSATPANSDVLGSIQFAGRDSGGGTDTYAQIQTEIIDTTATSEDAKISFQTNVAGTLATRGYVAQGQVVGSPTSGDMGVGTTNVVTPYVNGIAQQIVLDRVVTELDVNTTNTETTLYSYSMAGNTLGSTRKLRCTIFGDYINNTGNGRALTVNVKLGSTTVAAHDILSFTASASRRAFRLDFEISAANATNAQNSTSYIQFSNTAVGIAGADAVTAGSTNHSLAGYSGIAEDSTGTLAVTVTVTHAVSDANLGIRRKSATLELV